MQRLAAAYSGPAEAVGDAAKTTLDAPRTTKQAERMKELRAKEASGEAEPARAGSKAPIKARLGTNKDLEAGVHSDVKASPQLLRLIANMLEAALQRRAGGSWAKLFFQTDRDKSGSVEFDEFRALVRKKPTDSVTPGLGIAPAALSDDELAQLWTALDADRNGKVPAPEFKAFIDACRAYLTEDEEQVHEADFRRLSLEMTAKANEPPAAAADDDDYADDDFDADESPDKPSVLSSLLALDGKRAAEAPPDDEYEDSFEAE